MRKFFMVFALMGVSISPAIAGTTGQCAEEKKKYEYLVGQYFNEYYLAEDKALSMKRVMYLIEETKDPDVIRKYSRILYKIANWHEAGKTESAIVSELYIQCLAY